MYYGMLAALGDDLYGMLKQPTIVAIHGLAKGFS
jgi:hypothetical protein